MNSSEQCPVCTMNSSEQCPLCTLYSSEQCPVCTMYSREQYPVCTMYKVQCTKYKVQSMYIVIRVHSTICTSCLGIRINREVQIITYISSSTNY